MLFLYPFSYKLCLILFGHTAIMYQYRWTLWGARGYIVMIHIVPISPPLFFRPPKFIVWVVTWYFDFCHLRVQKKIKERFRTDIPEITLKRTDKSYSPLYSLSPDYVVGRSCRTDPAPFRFPAKYLLIKALCRCKDLNLASFQNSKIYWGVEHCRLYQSTDTISDKREEFSLPWNIPRKTWLRIKDEPNS